MGKSCYVCLYTIEGSDFFTLVGVKNFSYTRIKHGEKVSDKNHRNGPFAVFSNPGQHIYPGGKSNTGESALAAGLRQLEEVTGVIFTPTFPDSRELEIAFGSETLTCLHHIMKYDHYNCVYIHIESMALMKRLQGKINKNISSNLTSCDELEKVSIVELMQYHDRDIHPKFLAYCEQYKEILVTPKTAKEWKTVFAETTLLADLPSKFTKTNDVEKFGVHQFGKENYNIKPFMQKLKDMEFKLLNDQYAFLKTNDTGFPSRFSTDWFSAIAERIPEVHVLVTTEPSIETEKAEVSEEAAAAAAETIFTAVEKAAATEAPAAPQSESA